MRSLEIPISLPHPLPRGARKCRFVSWAAAIPWRFLIRVKLGLNSRFVSWAAAIPWRAAVIPWRSVRGPKSRRRGPMA